MARRRGHAWVDHAADLAVELFAPDEEGLLEEGARAIVERLTEGLAQDEGSKASPTRAPQRSLEARVITLEAIDREDRLAAWLNEVLFLAVNEGWLFLRADFSLSPLRLEARAEGEPGASNKIVCELKSVTQHALAIKEGPEGLSAIVVIDV